MGWGGETFEDAFEVCCRIFLILVVVQNFNNKIIKYEGIQRLCVVRGWGVEIARKVKAGRLGLVSLERNTRKQPS